MSLLCRSIFEELEERDSIFGIPRALFFRPVPDDRFATEVYGQPLDTPFGVAAGPHSQLAQNIVVAWLCGARFMELKTVQTLDELEIPKPCIDMQDAGYNVEWSQELKVHESLDEYVRAFVLIHALHRRLGLPGDRPGVIFNMSVGYNLEGIREGNMQAFLCGMGDAEELLSKHVELVAAYFPGIRDCALPTIVSDNVTLSTMHGCPPDEIGQIATYLMREWGLHTSVKLNPTLLGPERVREILNDRLGYRDIVVPDAAFEHDPVYSDAVELIRELESTAEACGVVFGVKLSNTLEVINHRDIFAESEKQMYLSGRPLHALTVNIAADLATEFDGRLLISFAGGADAFNVPDLLAGGMRTVTTCSDLLRPGGYLRLPQYIERTSEEMAALGAEDLHRFAIAVAERRSSSSEAATYRSAALANLRGYANDVLDDRTLHSDAFDRLLTKTRRSLGTFDCIEAPCSDECAIDQQVPEYMRLVREGRFGEAVSVTREDNHLAAVLGHACDHLCERVCIRTHQDEPLAIREIKRFIMEHEREVDARAKASRDARVGVIGAGPCGLSAAGFLAEAGYGVELFEAREYAGGMVAGTIPLFRVSQGVVDQDLRRLEALGAKISTGVAAGRDLTLSDLRARGFDYVVVAAGAQVGLPLGIEGEEGEGVLDGLALLRDARNAQPPALEGNVGVIGGGDVAMDCARAAARLGATEVSILYRRTRAEMPAQDEEIEAVLEEGIGITELVAPLAARLGDGRLIGLECARMRLGVADASGRRRPEDTGERFVLPLDALIVAIGQRADLGFFGGEPVRINDKGWIEVDPKSMRTSLSGVYAGGDVAGEGPSNIVGALGDGRRIARDIRRREEGVEPAKKETQQGDLVDLLRRRALRDWRVKERHRPPEERKGFEEIVKTLTPEDAIAEAERCLDCDLFCSTCVSVCPNLAFFTYETAALEVSLPVLEGRDGGWIETSKTSFALGQSLQVAVLTDFCNECGNCESFCPTARAPYQDKPRLYLDGREFEAETDNAYHLRGDTEAWTLRARFDGATHELSIGEEWRYRSPNASVLFAPGTLDVIEAECEDGERVSLDRCATMFVLGRGSMRSMGHLLRSTAVSAD